MPSSFRGRNVVPLKHFQRLLGHMASIAAATPLGLLHMRPLQLPRDYTPKVGMAPRYTLSKHHSTVSPLPQPLDGPCLSTGLEQVSWHTVVTTLAYCCPARAGAPHETGRHPRGSGLLWHINCLELWTVHLALRQFRPLLLSKHVLVRTDNTATVSYINRFTFTFMHLADAFIQSDLQSLFSLTVFSLYIYFFLSVCVPWESNPQPLRC